MKNIKTETNATVAVAIQTRIDALIAQRKTWQHGVYTKSNDELYLLLDECYVFYKELSGNDKDAKAAQVALNQVMFAAGVGFNKSTHMLAKVVKFVFDGVDRRRVSSYSLVLREALAQEIVAGDIPAFITNGGGVEEIRRSKSKTATTSKQKAEFGKKVVERNQLAVINSDSVAQKLDVTKVGQMLVAIVVQQADGSLIVRELVDSATALNAALASAYSANQVVGKTDKKNAKAANDEAARNELIEKVANS